MADTNAIRSYLLADDRFFETLGRFDFADDLTRRVRERLGATVETAVEGIWTRARPYGAPVLPEHGWKIHMSATPANALQAADLVCGEYEAAPFVFKILRDTRLVAASGARWWPRGSAGKVVTVYSRSPEDCRALLDRFAAAFAGFSGPYILSDRRFADSAPVFYRYGEFLKSPRVRPDGRVETMLTGPSGERWPDLRSPAYRKPPWVPDLIATEQPAGVAGDSPLSRYKVLKALHHSTSGGVYLADDLLAGGRVVLKEARPATAFSPGGSDAQERLRREYEVLQMMASTGLGPRPVELFQAWEHLYLAEEWIYGMSLRTFVARNNPVAQGDMGPEALAEYRTSARRVLENVRAAVGTCRSAGLVYGDLSPTNILIDPDSLHVRLIDFEASRPLTADHKDYPRTRGFCPPDSDFATAPGEAFDDAGLAGVEIALVVPANELVGLNPAALVRITRHAAALIGWPLDREVFGKLGVDAGPDTDLDVEPVGYDAAAVDAIVADGVEFILGTMTPDRADRLFPADAAVFATNAFGLAHGAAGVLRALYRLTGQVPEAAWSWLDRNLPDADRLPPGLHYGWAGVASAMIGIGEEDRGIGLLDRVVAGLDAVPAYDIATGLAGIGTALLESWLTTGTARHLEAADRTGRLLLAAARDDGTGLHWPDPDNAPASAGYASGSSGVAGFLLYLHLATGREEFLRIGCRALQFDLATARPRRVGIGFPGRIDSQLIEPYWARGSAGVGSAVIRYAATTGEADLFDVLDRLMTPTLSPLSINPGLFYGMAGLANFALDHDHLLGGDRYRAQAETLAGSILNLGCRQPEGLAFPGHSLLRYTVDLASGSAGILQLLHRLAHPGPDFHSVLDGLLVPRVRDAGRD